MNELGPKILGTIDASDAAPALQQLLLAVDSTTILAITDEKGDILHVNDLFCKISKYEREELVGQNHRILKSGHHSPAFFTDMWRTIGSGKTWSGEIKNKAKDGSFYWVETSIVPFHSEDGHIHRYAAIRKDITDKKNLDEQIELERAKSLNAEKMAALGEMAAGISHEVGNPLGAIRGRVEMLRMSAETGTTDSETVIKTADTITRLVDRTTKIIKGLKSFARDASGDPMEEVDVGQVVTDIIDISRSRLDKGEIELIDELPKESIRALCREAEVGQVLVNLINNACDVLVENEERRIVVRLYKAEDNVCIEVEDSGPGIAPEARLRLFEPFFTTKLAGAGTGLGLSISRKIMESHGGSLELKEDETPTCFVLSWPRKGA